MSEYKNYHDIVKQELELFKQKEQEKSQRLQEAMRRDLKRLEQEKQQKKAKFEQKIEKEFQEKTSKQEKSQPISPKKACFPQRRENLKQTVITSSDKTVINSPNNHTIDNYLQELNNLIGLKHLKDEVRTYINFLQIQKLREQQGLGRSYVTLHSVFCGSPGTGKTTVARLMGQIYQQLGILKRGHLVETDRSGMVAGYVGQTAEKVNKLVEEALDGVLFIDEAYSLKPEESEKDFGQEAIDTLVKRMEDYRERFVVIVAGYGEEMERFINSNPGLKSRFNRYFHFQDYTPQELLAIFDSICHQNNYELTAESKEKLLVELTQLYSQRDKSFGNGRLVRNLFEKTIEKQANRLVTLPNLNRELIKQILPKDIVCL